MNNKNYGLILEKAKPEDHIFGKASIPFPVINPSGDWTPYLPIKEKQNLNGVETFACVSYTILNAIEILIKYTYGEERNYSERFLAYVSGTKNRNGNSPQVVAEFLRKLGVVPQDKWPFDASVASFDKFYEPLPPKLYELAKEFNTEWDFRYQQIEPVTEEDFLEGLKRSPTLVSVYAWIMNQKGQYYRPEGYNDIHATTMIYARKGEFTRVFDSYADYNDSVIKDYISLPQFAMVFQIKKKLAPAPIISSPPTTDIGNALINLIKWVISFIKPQRNVPDTKPVAPAVLSPREKLYRTALSCLGMDASPQDVAPDELGCMETVNSIFFKAFGEYIETPGLSTTRGFAAMVDRADKFVRVLDPEPGNIIISPTGFSRFSDTPIKNGHIGIFGKGGIIMSNSSSTGKWTENYTPDTWDSRYRVKGGYPVYYFKVI